MAKFDYILVGGGLQSGLLALALQHFQPTSRVLLLEAAARIGGNHTWSFHATDLPAELRPVVEPLIERSWPAHEVRFPGYSRRIESGYSTIPSHRLHEALVSVASNQPNFEIRFNSRATNAASTQVTTEEGQSFESSVVVDARGPEAFAATKPTGYQKFVGIEFEVDPETAPSLPTLIDATVEQLDGFRFFYVLPLSARRVLVEDTYFSESPQLHTQTLEAGIVDYLNARDVRIERVLRTETGVLPLPRAGVQLSRHENSPLLAGYKGGWFHPTTGYSFPLAARLSLAIAQSSRHELDSRLTRLMASHKRQLRFCLLLNRLLFDGFAPEDRKSVFERFYRLPEETIHRFYALRLTRTDQLRILCGRPPTGFRTRRLIHRITSPELELTGGQ